jgi:hypothetical protein
MEILELSFRTALTQVKTVQYPSKADNSAARCGNLPAADFATQC